METDINKSNSPKNNLYLESCDDISLNEFKKLKSNDNFNSPCSEKLNDKSLKHCDDISPIEFKKSNNYFDKLNFQNNKDENNINSETCDDISLNELKKIEITDTSNKINLLINT